MVEIGFGLLNPKILKPRGFSKRPYHLCISPRRRRKKDDTQVLRDAAPPRRGLFLVDKQVDSIFTPSILGSETRQGPRVSFEGFGFECNYILGKVPRAKR